MTPSGSRFALTTSPARLYGCGWSPIGAGDETYVKAWMPVWERPRISA